MPLGIDSITVWVNAFLPRDVTGLTTTLPSGRPHAGKTAVVGPAYYVTDQRAFSNDRRAPCRMQSCITVDFGSCPALVGQVHRCDPTIMCALGSEEAPREACASTRGMHATVSCVEPTVVIHLDGRASHPFPHLTPLRRDVAYRGEIMVDRAARIVAVDLMIQLFPAFEGYAAINDGPAGILFRHAPPPGVSELQVSTEPQRRIRCRLQDEDGDGVFEGATSP